jgi:hypothetical protein
MVVMLGSSHAIRGRANVYAVRERERAQTELAATRVAYREPGISRPFSPLSSVLLAAASKVQEQPTSMHIPWQSGIRCQCHACSSHFPAPDEVQFGAQAAGGASQNTRPRTLSKGEQQLHPI